MNPADPTLSELGSGSQDLVSPVGEEEIQAALARIRQSPRFRDSPALQRLLAHLVQESWAGRFSELKEYTLGLTVFHRGDAFDPRTDSIVRVQVGVLRKKLAAYYAAEGAHDPLRIEVPRGGYATRFERQIPPSEPRVEEPIPLPATGQDVALRTRGFCLGPWLGILAGLLLGSLGTVAYLHRSSAAVVSATTPPAEFEWRQHTIWKGFFEPGATTQLVLGSPLMLRAGGLLIRDSQVNLPEDVGRSSKLKQFQQLTNSSIVPDEVYTGLGEAAGVYLLTHFFWTGGRDLPPVRNRLARWQDLTHGNLIFLSSFRFRMLNQELPLGRDFAFDGPKSVVRNLHPQPGELASYTPSMSANGVGGTDYAVISVWPGTLPGRRIMALGGSHTWGTEGAAQYVTDPPSLRDLTDRLRPTRARDRGRGLQILLKVTVKDRQPVALEYVTHHWLAENTP